MVFCFIVLVAVLSGFAAMKKGFFQSWVNFFNSIVSIYLGVMLTPVLIESVKELQGNLYYEIITICVITAAVFGFLHTFSKHFFVENFDFSFGVVLEKTASATLGFLTGFLMISFCIFLLYMMPFSKNETAEKFLGRAEVDSIAVKSVKKGCNFVSAISMQCRTKAVNQQIDRFITGPQPQEDAQTHSQPENDQNSLNNL